MMGRDNENNSSPTSAGEISLADGLTPFRDHAMDYSARGWAVFPLHPLKKTPLTRDGFKSATREAATLEAWARQYPQANIGIATEQSDLTVVDLDSSKGETPPEKWNLAGVLDGSDVLAVVAEKRGEFFPADTYSVSTPNAGAHLYFHDQSRTIKSSAGKVGWKVDIRSLGGYVVAAGSALPSGRYVAGNAEVVSELPAWLRLAIEEAEKRTPAVHFSPIVSRQAISKPKSYIEAGLKSELLTLANAREGERNETLNRVSFAVGRLVAMDRNYDEFARNSLLQIALSIGLGEWEAKRTIASGYVHGVQAAVSNVGK